MLILVLISVVIVLLTITIVEAAGAYCGNAGDLLNTTKGIAEGVRVYHIGRMHFRRRGLCDGTDDAKPEDIACRYIVQMVDVTVAKFITLLVELGLEVLLFLFNAFGLKMKCVSICFRDH